MILRFSLLALALSSASALHAQETDGKNSATKVAKPSRDYVMIQLTHERWRDVPDSVKTAGFGRGLNAYLCYDFPIKKSSFSFAAGVGIGSSNMYFADQRVVFADSSQTAALSGKQVRFVNSGDQYDRFKLTTIYAEAPLELRYFSNPENRNRGFKAAAGLRVGTLLSAYTKGKREFDGNNIVDKQITKRYFENLRFAGTLRLGYGNFSVLGTYNLNSLFRETEGPQITPYSIGLCISGL